MAMEDPLKDLKLSKRASQVLWYSNFGSHACLKHLYVFIIYIQCISPFYALHILLLWQTSSSRLNFECVLLKSRFSWKSSPCFSLYSLGSKTNWLNHMEIWRIFHSLVLRVSLWDAELPMRLAINFLFHNLQKFDEESFSPMHSPAWKLLSLYHSNNEI